MSGLGRSLKRKSRRTQETGPLLQKAIAHFHARNWQAADSVCRDILRINPKDHRALNLLSVVLTHKPDLIAAEKLARRAIAIKPGEAAYHSNLGLILKEQEKWDAAFRAFDRACRIQPDDDESLYNLGTVYQAVREKDKALECYRQAVSLNPAHVQALCSLADLLSRDGGENDELDAIMGRMESLANRSSIQAKEQLYFAMARVRDRLGSYDRAFSFLERANGLFREQFNYDVTGELDYFQSVIQGFSSGVFAEKQGAGEDSSVPIFIVGMPRSGTTLVERIIASHSKVAAGGELHFLNSVILKAPALAVPFRPDTIKLPNYARIGEVGKNEMQAMARAYLEAVKPLRGDKRHLTDKMPHNFIHMGMISLLFPNCRIIHCQRHPLDNGLSLYMQHFRVLHPYMYTLEEIGRYYAGYHKLMAHWHGLLPGFIHTVQYEALVTEPQQVVRKLLAFCGLDWEDSCLEFHKLDRQIKTASEGQADRPLYTSSVGRWRNYADHLRPLKKIFREEGVL